jgi:spore maturation protein CgeB
LEKLRVKLYGAPYSAMDLITTTRSTSHKRYTVQKRKADVFRPTALVSNSLHRNRGDNRCLFEATGAWGAVLTESRPATTGHVARGEVITYSRFEELTEAAWYLVGGPETGRTLGDVAAKRSKADHKHSATTGVRVRENGPLIDVRLDGG